MRSSVQAMSVLQNPLPGCGRRRQRLRDRSMSSQPPFGEIQSAVANAPGVPVIRNVNWGGLRTLYVKEVRRFFKDKLQTIWAPAITTLDRKSKRLTSSNYCESRMQSSARIKTSIYKKKRTKTTTN